MSDLVRITHGVWRPAELVADPVNRLESTLAACPAGTVVSGWTAAQLHGLWLPRRDGRPVEVIVHPEQPQQASRPGIRRRELRARRQELLPDEMCLVSGLPVTSIARTWLDLAAQLRAPDLIAAGDCALRSGATLADLEIVTARAVHRRGVVNARACLPLLDARSRSRPESHLRYAVVSAGLPPPEVNVAIYSEHGEWLAEPDLSYDDVRLALEYNGAEHADLARMRRDMTRSIDMTQRGRWQVVAFGPAEVFGRPDMVGALVRQLRHERSAIR